MAWTKPEIVKLIDIWSDEAIQAQLEGCRRNQDVYEKIGHKLAEAGFEWTYQQCQDKLKKLRADYKRIKDKRGKTREGSYPDWHYFDPLDAVLGHKPETKPTVTIDTLQEDSPGIDEVTAGDRLHQNLKLALVVKCLITLKPLKKVDKMKGLLL